MPILDIEIVASDSTLSLPANLIQSLADQAVQVFGAPQGTVWVKVRVIPSAHYAEDHGKPTGINPVFVTVLKARVQERSQLKSEIKQLTQTIAKLLNRPDTNVHIVYQPDGINRVAFGGKLVE